MTNNRIAVTIVDKTIHLPLPTEDLMEWIEANIIEHVDLETMGLFFPVSEVNEVNLKIEGQKTNIFYLNLYLSLLGSNKKEVEEVYTSLSNLKKEICHLLGLNHTNYSLLKLVERFNEKKLDLTKVKQSQPVLNFSIHALQNKQKEINEFAPKKEVIK